METSVIIIAVIAIICTLGVLGLFHWFVRRKNPTKIGNTENRKEQVERPTSTELEDPLNPTENNN